MLSDASWESVARFFGALPAPQYQTGALLRYGLTAAHGPSARFTAIFSGPTAYPLLDLSEGVVRDWGGEGALAEAVQLAVFYLFAARFLDLASAAPETCFTPADRVLVPLLEAQARAALARHFPPESPAWGALEAAPAGRWSITRLPLAAAAEAGSRAGDLLAASTALERFNRAYEGFEDLLALPRDVASGRWTEPVRRACEAAGLPLQPPPKLEAVVGALWLTGTARKLCAESEAELGAAGAEARRLDLPSLAAQCARLTELWRAMGALLTLKPPAVPAPIRFKPAPRPPSAALAAAEGYLLSDPTCRESWEVQRSGMLGEAELVSAVFGPGLVIECLCPAHPELCGEVARLAQSWARSGYRYYPHPAIPPDADDLGLFLRLGAYAPDSSAHRALLGEPLRWLAQHVTAAGRIPCWFTRAPGAEGRPPDSWWGDDCATVEANVLSGLLAHDAAAHAEIIGRVAPGWLRRFLELGVGGNAYYTKPYALCAAIGLTLQVRASPHCASLREVAGAAFERGITLLAAAAGEPAITAQAAALFTHLCLSTTAPAELRALFRPEWVSELRRAQCYDGGWPAEALFLCPTRDSQATWYASRLVTSAFCYRALRAGVGQGL